MEVSYQTRRADAWRCNLYLLLGNGRVFAFLLAVLLGGWLLGPTLFHASHWGGFGMAAWCVFLGIVPTLGLLWIGVGGQFPERESTRACTTRLDGEGVQDTTPNGTKFIPWASVVQILLFRGDVYFRARAGRGFFVPRSAFTNEAHGREYVEEARRLLRLADRVPAQRLAFESGGVQSITPIKPAKITLTPSQQRGCSWLMSVPVILIMLIATGWGAIGWWTDGHRAAVYHRSPGCTPTAPKSSPLPPCTVQTLTVARAWVVYNSKSPDDDYLTLQGPGVTQTIEVRRTLWDRLAVGTPVQAKLWRGRVVRAGAFGLTSRTDDDPDYALYWDKRLMMIGLVGLVFFAWLVWSQLRRKPKDVSKSPDTVTEA